MKRNVLIISAITVFLDQVIKFFVERFLLSEFIVIPNFFSFLKIYNNGAAFSILSGQVSFLIFINIIIFLFLFKYMNNFKVNFRNKMAFGLVFGGLLGNLIDRIRLGLVIDYLKFDFWNYTFPIFNLADICLCVGLFLIVIGVIRKEDEV